MFPTSALDRSIPCRPPSPAAPAWSSQCCWPAGSGERCKDGYHRCRPLVHQCGCTSEAACSLLADCQWLAACPAQSWHSQLPLTCPDSWSATGLAQLPPAAGAGAQRLRSQGAALSQPQCSAQCAHSWLLPGQLQMLMHGWTGRGGPTQAEDGGRPCGSGKQIQANNSKCIKLPPTLDKDCGQQAGGARHVAVVEGGDDQLHGRQGNASGEFIGASTTQLAPDQLPRSSRHEDSSSAQTKPSFTLTWARAEQVWSSRLCTPAFWMDCRDWTAGCGQGRRNAQQGGTCFADGRMRRVHGGQHVVPCSNGATMHARRNQPLPGRACLDSLLRLLLQRLGQSLSQSLGHSVGLQGTGERSEGG